MIRYFKPVNSRIRQLDDIEDGCWIDVVNPDEKEINSLIQDFSLEPDFLRAALDEEESSRIETEDGNTLIILDAPAAEKNGAQRPSISIVYDYGDEDRKSDAPGTV